MTRFAGYDRCVRCGSAARGIPMFGKSDLRGFGMWASQSLGLDNEALNAVAVNTAIELHRYGIPKYTPIRAFSVTVLDNGELVAVSICRWLFLSLVDYYMRNGIPIPEIVAQYFLEVLRPIVASKLKKYQGYNFVVSQQRIDESTAITIENLYGTGDTQFLIPRILKGKSINGIECEFGIDQVERIQYAIEAGQWIALYKRSDSKLMRVSPMPRYNVVRSCVSVSCRKFVEYSIGKSLGKGSPQYLVTGQDENLFSTLATESKQRREFPLGEFLHDASIYIGYRAVMYAESIEGLHQDRRAEVASEYAQTLIPLRTYYRILKTAKKVANRFYRDNVVIE
jgi:hypothetical protein